MPLIFSLYDLQCRSTQNKPEYTVRFTVRSDENDRLEIQPKRILNQFTIPTVYTGFNVDDEDLEAGLTEIDIGEDVTDDDGVCYRMLTLRYGVSDEGTPRPPHETEQDPLEWEPQIFIRNVERSITPDRLMFLGAYTSGGFTEGDPLTNCEECQGDVHLVTLESVLNGACNMLAATYDDGPDSTGKLVKAFCYPIQSTAGEAMSSPPQIKKTDKEITVIVNIAEVQGPDFDIEGCYENTVNSEPFEIDLPLQGFRRYFYRWTCRLEPIHLELRSRKWRDAEGVQQTRVYWEKRYVIVERRTGWFLDVLNKGSLRAAGPGDKASDGTTVLINADLKPNDPLQVVLEREGFTGREFRLGLDGQPIVVANDPSVYLRYQERLTNFNDAVLGLPVVDPVGEENE